MKPDEMKARTRAFACESFDSQKVFQTSQQQMLLGIRCCVRAHLSARITERHAEPNQKPILSRKWGTVEEEADETMYWIELSIDAGIVKKARVDSLLKEANEIVSITVSSIKTAKRIRLA